MNPKYLFLLLLFILATHISAESFTYDGVHYSIISNSNKTVEVAASSSSAGSDGNASYWDDVTIPETVYYGGTAYTVVGIGESAFVNCAGMTSISLPNSLTYIQKEAFKVCLSLKEITIPRNVSYIGYGVFDVTSISKITVESPIPAACDYDAFFYPQSYNNCVLYVPSGAKKSYENSPEWNKFKSIIEICHNLEMLDGHEYVDLGLTSGILWSTTNYGANSPSNYGSYLNWSQNRFVTDNWGESWHTPTRNEFCELLEQCSWTWTTQSGVNGYKVTGVNGNSIFLPATGFKLTMGGDAQSLGNQLYYWTSTPSTESDFYFALTATPSSINTSSTFNAGLMMCTVRPCAKKAQKKIFVTSIEFDQDNISLKKGQAFTLSYTVLPTDATDKSVVWKSSDNNVVTVDNGTVTAKEEGAAVIIATTNDGSNLSAYCIISVASKNYVSEPEAIDMGLPSGTRWAKYNLGANNPDEPGHYYSWGEITPKESYYWDNYRFGTKDNLTKYCLSNEVGEYDGLSTLSPEDDTASALLGENWKMPTKADFYELKNNSLISWSVQNGRKGVKFVSKTNGNEIFMPLCGYMDGVSLKQDNYYGNYWITSLAYDKWCFQAEYIDLVGTTGDIEDWVYIGAGSPRYYGFNIRPINVQNVMSIRGVHSNTEETHSIYNIKGQKASPSNPGQIYIINSRKSICK